MLVYLLIHAGKPVTAEALIDELWGDQPPATAHNTLQTYVRHIRQLLEPERKPRQKPRVLRTVPNGYLLDVQADCIDSERFEHSLSEGRAALQACQIEAARTVLREGLSLWRGPALGEPTGFAAAEREADRLTQLRLVGTELRIKADLALGHHAEVIAELEHLARRNPLREDLIELLMVALYRCGRQAEALTAYRAAHERLIEEAGISPCVALQEMQQRILRQDPALDLPAGSAAAPQVDSPSPSRRWIWLAASLLTVAAGIVAWTSGWIRPEGATTGSGPTTSTPVVFNEYELAVKPGIGYDLDVPPGQPPDWHSTNNPRSPGWLQS